MSCYPCYDTDGEGKMKTDRLIGILSVLLQKDKTTAPELAEQFEVSRRTINRDIETLCMAGIPIQTLRGPDGGIRIMIPDGPDNTDLPGYADDPGRAQKP